MLAAENALETARIESFTVRLVHSVPMNLRCGFAPLFIIHTASLPCRYAHQTAFNIFTQRARTHAHAHIRHARTTHDTQHTAKLIVKRSRVEKIISFWSEGQEVRVEEDGKAAAIHVDQGMSSLVQVKPLVERSRLQPFVCTPLSDRCLPTAQGDVFVEPYARNPALGTVLVSGMGPVTAHGRIESVFRQGQGTTS